MSAHNKEKLIAHILPLSRAQSFDEARREWIVDWIEILPDFSKCPCGQSIKEVCHISNRDTRHKTSVGNICVTNFIGIPTGNTFSGLARIMKNKSANPNLELIEYAVKRGFLHENEPHFLRTTARTRNLSDKQRAWKEKINWRIIHANRLK